MTPDYKTLYEELAAWVESGEAAAHSGDRIDYGFEIKTFRVTPNRSDRKYPSSHLILDLATKPKILQEIRKGGGARLEADSSERMERLLFN